MRTLLIDLDGVLNTDTGNYDPNFIPPIREGAKEFLTALFKIKNFLPWFNNLLAYNHITRGATPAPLVFLYSNSASFL